MIIAASKKLISYISRGGDVHMEACLCRTLIMLHLDKRFWLTLSSSLCERCKKKPITKIIVKHLLSNLQSLSKHLEVSHRYAILK